MHVCVRVRTSLCGDVHVLYMGRGTHLSLMYMLQARACVAMLMVDTHASLRNRSGLYRVKVSPPSDLMANPNIMLPSPCEYHSTSTALHWSLDPTTAVACTAADTCFVCNCMRSEMHLSGSRLPAHASSRELVHALHAAQNRKTTMIQTLPGIVTPVLNVFFVGSMDNCTL